MNTYFVRESVELRSPYSHAFGEALSSEALQRVAPAAFAERAHEHTKSRYTFISTQRVIGALQDVGFMPVFARQTVRRGERIAFARHLVKFRRRIETVTLSDAIPELVLLNAHDGTSAYQLRVGLYRPVCTNGLMAAMGDFASVHIPHRGDVVESVVVKALELGEQFGVIGERVRQMEQRTLLQDEREEFGARALALRFDAERAQGVGVEQVLAPKRDADRGVDLWSTYNVAQEHLIRGGLHRRTPSGRLAVTRGIRAIREDVRLNVGLWNLASSYLPA